jgi:hypothetical protein
VTSRTTGAVIASLTLGPAEVLLLDFGLGLAYDQFQNGKENKNNASPHLNHRLSITNEKQE